MIMEFREALTAAGHRRQNGISMPAGICLAGAVVVHDDHILLVRRSKKEHFLPEVWGVPCGKVEDGESPRNAVLRELREETGLRGEVVSYVGQLTFSSHRGGRTLHNLQHNYLVRLPEAPKTLPKIKLPEKDQRAQWVHPRDLEKTGLDDHNLDAIHQALSRFSPRNQAGR